MKINTVEEEEGTAASASNFGTSEEGRSLSTKLYICGILAVIHTLHNNFFTNLRISLSVAKAEAVCCWKPVNYCICKFGAGDQKNGLQYLCRDRCCNLPIFVKSIIYCLTFILIGNSAMTSVQEYGNTFGERLNPS
jgi:hypothetical protein